MWLWRCQVQDRREEWNTEKLGDNSLSYNCLIQMYGSEQSSNSSGYGERLHLLKGTTEGDAPDMTSDGRSAVLFRRLRGCRSPEWFSYSSFDLAKAQITEDDLNTRLFTASRKIFGTRWRPVKISVVHLSSGGHNCQVTKGCLALLISWWQVAKWCTT